MDYTNFIDKKEQTKLEIIKLLLFQSKRVTKKEIAETLNIVFQTMETYISEIKYELTAYLDTRIELTETEDIISLNKPDDINLAQIIYCYLQNSYKYKIILFLFNKGQFTYGQLEEELSASRSTIYPKLVELNQSLSEFDLQIFKGRLIGSEFQIRYFYFLFRTQLLPFERLVQSMTDQDILEVISDLNNKMHADFSIESQTKIYTWMDVTAHRYLTESSFDYKNLIEIEELIPKSHFFRKLHAIFKQIQEVRQFSRDEIDGIYLYTVSICFSFSPQYFTEYLQWDVDAVLDNFSVPEVNDFITNFLDSHLGLGTLTFAQYNEICFLFLQAIFQYYFFKGFIFSYDESHYKQSISANETMNSTNYTEQFIKEFLQLCHIKIYNAENPLDRNFQYRICSLFKIIDIWTEKKILIGFRSHEEYSTQLLLKEFWKKALSPDFPVQVELYQPRKHYDLIISDYSFIQNEDLQNTYILSDLNSEYDLSRLRSKIKELNPLSPSSQSDRVHSF